MNRNHLTALAAAIALSTSATAQNLSTLFISNAGSSSFHPLSSVSFDVTVTNTAGLALSTIQVNTPYVGIPATLEVYTTDLGVGYLANLQNPPAGTWKLRAKGNFSTGGSDSPVTVTLDKLVHLEPGTMGMLLVHRGCGIRYTNPGTSGTPLIYTNADLTLSMGSAQSTALVSTPNTPRIANVDMQYSVPADLVDFTVDVTSGASPLTVNFQQRAAMTSAPAAAYEWDFENDGIVDATGPNPTWIYPTCGTFSPKLRVLTTAGNFEYTWTDLITADPLVADFTASANLVPPQTSVQFTDTSVGAAGWLWDFENDGIVDSTLQNPSFTFGAGSYDVKLTVTNGCGLTSKTMRIDAVTDTWSLPYNASTNLTAKQALAFFDLGIAANDALILTGLDVNTIVHIGQPCPVKVWLTDGTAAGKQTNQALWREVASGNGISAAGNAATRITLDRPILLLPGRSYGMAVQYLDAQVHYVTPLVPVTSGPDFVFTPIGITTATNPFSLTNTTRQFVGGFYYTKASAWPIGSITTFAQGCAGSLGVPTLQPAGSSRPQLGTSFTINLDNAALGGAVVMFGFSNTMSAFGPLPLDLGFYGAPGCSAYVSTDATTFRFSGQPLIPIVATLPNDPALAGIRYYMQALTIDPTANALGSVMSDALALCTGVY
ncbi:MAG: PKD domain-containing protein [Planctomycetes bacterium]|nr:PKD domain-containing protein [Planctomycetota bacterium]